MVPKEWVPHEEWHSKNGVTCKEWKEWGQERMGQALRYCDALLEFSNHRKEWKEWCQERMVPGLRYCDTLLEFSKHTNKAAIRYRGHNQLDRIINR